MAAAFNLKIITPSEVVFAAQAENVIVRTTVGDKGILARHEPYVAALPIGKVQVKEKDSPKFRTAAISAGTIRVEDNGDTVVLVHSCEWSDQIDVSRAESAKTKAQQRISDESASRTEHDIAELKLKRALNRLDIAKM